MTSVSDTVAEYGMGYLFTHDLFSTDDLALVRQVVDRVYVLHRGRVVESSAVESRLLIGMTELSAAFQSSFPTLSGRLGADYDALE